MFPHSLKTNLIFLRESQNNHTAMLMDRVGELFDQQTKVLIEQRRKMQEKRGPPLVVTNLVI